MAVSIRFLFAALPLLPVLAGANANQPLDHPYTLRNHTPFLLEAEHHRMIQGTAPRSYIFPRPCISALDSSNVCAEVGGWNFRDSLNHRLLSISPAGGYEYRYLGENVHAVDFGFLTQGYLGPVSFHLDARMFTEKHDDLYHASYDREFLERQDEEASGSVAYASYSRYRSNLSYDWSWGRVTVARDAAHWGPGLFTNLVFQQDAIPFNQLTFTTYLGPVTVQSLYGQLATGGDWQSEAVYGDKTMFAHRYEWRPGMNWVLGISEQLVLYKTSDPFAFVPFVPLFISKAGSNESTNNGNIAADFSYRIPGLAAFYSEFLIDDLQSPTSLFDDYWGNKWGWMTGIHLSRGIETRKWGFITEYSRVEPWVYTHYTSNTAQADNGGYPLGNPFGPNSQVILVKGYARILKAHYLGLKIDWLWHGQGQGSFIEDIQPNVIDGQKIFLDKVNNPRMGIDAKYGYTLRRVSVLISGVYDGKMRFRLALSGGY